ncbi:hypothetical protein BD324DRAFT_615261 [Kockovaella imperatae]|uniref:Uncharacterized protein n=1 Tax=Kockovaella imperatae TaxID=4999 RepID=A0A1Y1UQL4_9TREE|nr:hypothetical protein BD324DRAFT_615261 [Kockovaella imperatae]ORX39857.1 hypothetical protein BD324DRAFT_615261 [Kockovaella imperatae]
MTYNAAICLESPITQTPLMRLPLLSAIAALFTSVPVTSSSNITRSASSMVLETGKMNVLHGPLQPLTRSGDSTHPAGFMRDGTCWGLSSSDDPGQHYVGAVVSKEFLEFSKARGNDLTNRTPYFPGLKDGCKWCLCVARWKEAFMASSEMGDKIVPKVILDATAYDTLKQVKIEDLKKFEFKDHQRAEL